MIQRANLDGTAIETLVSGSLTGVREIALDTSAGKMYCVDIDAHYVRRANLDGSNIEVLWSGDNTIKPQASMDLDLGGGQMYWTDYGPE